MILNLIGQNYVKTSIPLTLQLAAVLRFFAEGSFQRSVGNDAHISMHRTTVSKLLTTLLPCLERKLCKKFIKVKSTDEDLKTSKKFFYEKHGIPGIVGCIDGTHISIKRPTNEEYIYFNRKGYYSINAMIVSIWFY